MSRRFALCVVIAAVAATTRAEQAATPTGAPGATQRVDYRMDVAPIRESAGVAGLRLTITDSSDGGVVRRFEVVDEKRFHLFVVGRDLKFFRHLFPALLPDGSLEAREPIPAGEYLVIADFLPAGGTPQFLRRVMTLGGAADRPGRSSAGTAAGAFDIVTNVRIQPLPFTVPAGERSAFHVMLSRTEDGRPLVNLEPYLGWGGHLLAVSEDLSQVVLGRAPTTGLPVSLLTFDMTFPTPGPYTVWVEFFRFGEPLAARFGVTAR
jgi:hypothetical protein